MATAAASVHSELPDGHPCRHCEVHDQAVCRVLGTRDLLRLRALGHGHHLHPGQPLFHEGDAAAQVYNVTSGTLKLYKLLPDGRRQVTGFIFPGNFLGITVEDDHAFSAEALEEVQLCSFPRGRFDDFVEDSVAMERELYRLAAHELAAAQAQMVLLGRKTAAERLASFFLNLLERAEHVRGVPQTQFDLPMTRLDMADYLGLTKETVSRMVSHLRNRGLIRLAALDRVEVSDRAALRVMAEGGSEG